MRNYENKLLEFEKKKKEVESKFFSKGNVPVIYSNQECHMITTR
jgi:hypothetical protein